MFANPFNGARDGGCSTQPFVESAHPFFAVDDDGLLPDGDEPFVNSWQVMSESVGKERSDAGRLGNNVGRSGSIYAWTVDARVVIMSG